LIPAVAREGEANGAELEVNEPPSKRMAACVGPIRASKVAIVERVKS
jgi:hypothetical protein